MAGLLWVAKNIRYGVVALLENVEIAYDIIKGDIMHVDILGQSFLIVSSLKIAEDLLEKRSSIYSDRPHFVRLPFRPWCRCLQSLT